MAEEVARTVYAKGFSKSQPLSDSDIRRIFEPCGRVRSVKLRKDDRTGAFRGSVYVEFDNETTAARAVSNPPTVPGAKEHLTVMMRSEYERKAAQYEAAGGKNGAAGKGSTGSAGSHQKRARVDAGSTPDGATGPSTSGAGARTNAYWQHLAEEREKRVKELEEALKAEKEHVHKVQEEADEAGKREQAAARKLLSKEVEVGTLKGEVTALRQQMHAKIDALHTQYKARIQQLEGKMEAQKNELALLKQAEREREREQQRAAAAAAGGPPAGTPPQRDSGGLLDDDL